MIAMQKNLGTTMNFLPNPVYHNGEEVCLLNQNLRNGEIARYVSVPIDYAEKYSPLTKLYTYTKRPFNKSLNTILFFAGGPGESSRSSEFDMPNVNVIFFEQRGISCSRPKDEKTFYNPKFYSSLNTARDAKEILKAYNVHKATIYGHSYGTVPATIFGSLFPSASHAIVLEGVIFKADHTLWLSSVKKDILTEYIQHLDESKKHLFKTLPKELNFPENWFGKISSMMFYITDGITKLDYFLNQIFTLDPDISKGLVNSFFPEDKPEEEFSFGDVTMGMIGCQELSMNDPQVSLNFKLDENLNLTPDLPNIDLERRCKPLHLTSIRPYYNALNYPISAPVFYFLGETDGATDLYQGLRHTKYVAKGKKEIYILNKGGHLPLLEGLKDGNSDNQDILKSIVERGSVDPHFIENFNAHNEFKWSKKF